MDNQSDETQSKASTRESIDVDYIIENETGAFGKYQVTNVLLLSFVTLFTAWCGSEFVFTTARIDSRCLISECEGPITDFRPGWILAAVPGDETSLSQCLRYNTTGLKVDEGVCSPEMFDNTTSISCEENVYENTDTIVYDFDLGCDEWRRTVIGSFRVVGSILCQPLTGFISDRWGRRTAMVINSFNAAWVGIVRYWSPNYVTFVVFQVLEAFLGGAGFACAFILVTEMTGTKFRTLSTAITFTLFSVGQITLALIAWSVPNWRALTLAVYVPQLATISFIWLAPESVRWYMSKGRFEEGENTLRRIAKVNRREISESSLTKLRHQIETEYSTSQQKSEKDPWLITLVMKHKPILLICVISPIWWIAMDFIFYGLLINAVNLAGDRYINFMIVSAVEIPGFWIGTLLLTKLGRKTVLVGGFWICSVCQIGFIFVSEEKRTLALMLYLLSKIVISAVGIILYVYVAELYPTKYRQGLFGFTVAVGNVGHFIVPLTPALSSQVWEPLPFTLFAVLGLVAGGLVILAPETRGKKLPDTLEEASSIGKRKS